MAILGTIAASVLLLAACKGQTAIETTSQSAETSTTTANEAAAEITYSDTGFLPASVNAKVGQAVAFKNTSSTTVQVNSVPHPQHTSFPVLNIGAIAAGESKSITFDQAGTYKYHNHLNVPQNGTVVVE